MIPVNKLSELKSETLKERIFLFLKKHKNNAYRAIDIIHRIKGNKSTIRCNLRDLSKVGRIKRKEIARGYTFYYYDNEVKK